MLKTHFKDEIQQVDIDLIVELKEILNIGGPLGGGK